MLLLDFLLFLPPADTSTAPRRNNGLVQPQNAPTIIIDIISQPRFNNDIDDVDEDDGDDGGAMVIVLVVVVVSLVVDPKSKVGTVVM